MAVQPDKLDPKQINNSEVILSPTGSNYFPYRPEVNLGFERDYKSYPEYTYDRSTYDRWDYLSNTGAGMGRASAPFTSGAPVGHRRQLSNISTSSNVNPTFHLERDEIDALYQLSNLDIDQAPIAKAMTGRMHVYENVPQRRLSQTYLEYSDYGSSSLPPVVDRPMSLPFDQQCGTKLRSSLKKYSFGSRPSTAPAATKTGSTPTNPTPPDSLTSDDSSYLSAREGSISSQSRVRFSPEALHEQNECSPHTMDATGGLQQPFRRLSRTRHSVDNEQLTSTTQS